ncbi:YebG family protein [Aquisalimonas sp.]|uniref:YebG family protein n=1 Tax=Aquisalimonas sp. TaxID=1872621 RepID=UPI0025C2288D|nr:YebG family protein [Aquisalimonas sp.]
MAVKALYVSDKDPKQMMFEKKADADARDKDLSVAEALDAFLRKQFPKVDDAVLEEIAYALGDRRTALAALAHKLDLDALDNAPDPTASGSQPSSEGAAGKSNVTTMAKDAAKGS